MNNGYEGAIISKPVLDTAYLPPATLLQNGSLFLDLDGTLLDLIDQPGEVVADADLCSLLENLERHLEGRLAIVSGRSLAQLDEILGPTGQQIALSGSHGCEHRWHSISAQPVRPDTLDAAAQRIDAFVRRNPGTLIEEKSFGVTLHFRMRPQVEADARKLAEAIAADLGLYLQEGKMMFELRVPGGDKGIALRRLMNHSPMRGTVPVFLGDDRTDEPAFVAAAELGGAGVLVGEPRLTAARYRLRDPAAVRAWLADAIA